MLILRPSNLSVGGSRMESVEQHPLPPQLQPPNPQRRYILSDDLYEVLKTSGATKGTPYPWRDVIMLLIHYLMKRKPSLLDPNDNSRVICAGDPIARVFGVNEFTKQQTKLLVRQHVTLVEDEAVRAALRWTPPTPAQIAAATAAAAAAAPVKRGAEDTETEEESKRGCPRAADGAGPSGEATSAAPQHTDADPSTAEDGAPSAPAPDSTSPEPAQEPDQEDSVEEEEEESSAAESASCDEVGGDDHYGSTYRGEMEPVDASDVDARSDTSGDSDIILEPIEVEMTDVAVWGDDLGVLADLETSCSDCEPRDTWLCTQHGCNHANSAKRSKCERCWTTRPDWVQGPRRRSRKRRDQRRLLSQLSRSSAGSDGQSGGSQESTSTSASASCSSADAADAAQPRCLICCEQRRDATLIHGRIGCQVTCYKCARRLWKRRDRCPACRRTISSIVMMRFG